MLFNGLKMGFDKPAFSVSGILGAVLMLSACASEPELTSGTDGSNLAAAPVKMVCEDQEVTGTRFKNRVCKTQADWDAGKKKNRAIADEYGRQTQENSAIMNDAAPMR